MWLNEGHASWYEFSSRLGLDSDAFTSFMKQVYAFGDLFRAFLGPVAQPPAGDLLTVFNNNVYLGGGLTLYALRQQVGDPAFRAIERAWITTFRGRSASTEDFIALASRVSGQDLTAFLRDWLFGTRTPRCRDIPTGPSTRSRRRSPVHRPRRRRRSRCRPSSTSGARGVLMG